MRMHAARTPHQGVFHTGVSRTWIWLQLLIGWVPMWALYSTLIVTAHPGSTIRMGILAGMRAIACAAALGFLVQRLTQRLPWPYPMRTSFIAVHAIAAPVYAFAWFGTASLVDGSLLILHKNAPVSSAAPVIPFLILGVWLYVMVAGITYASQAAQRASAAESLAVTSQLAALRSQLNPHFLFNALHTVVQLIPQAPAQATHAAEQLAALLRTSLEEDRDLVSLAEEWAFVERYLDLERIRFGERLNVKLTMDDNARVVLVPSFALQTLVENSVRHGAAPRIEPTTLSIFAATSAHMLTLIVSDDGVGSDMTKRANDGTGLARLRDRLGALFGDQADLTITSKPGDGFVATLCVPRTVPDSNMFNP